MPKLRPRWLNPLSLALRVTDDAESFRSMPDGVTGLPVGPHPGAFGVVRRHHVHEGVDLYAHQGTPVHAVEDGLVVAVRAFTGPTAGLPWWLDTQVVLVESEFGVVAYGEVEPSVAPGARVAAGQLVGRIARVLRHDKGRPTCMLHLELHGHGMRSCPEWLEATGQPAGLYDPTPLLLPLALPG